MMAEELSFCSWKSFEDEGRSQLEKGLKDEAEASFKKALAEEAMVSTALELMKMNISVEEEKGMDLETSAVVAGIREANAHSIAANPSLGLCGLAEKYFEEKPEYSLKLYRRESLFKMNIDAELSANLALSQTRLHEKADDAVHCMNASLLKDNTKPHTWLNASEIALQAGDLLLATSMLKIAVSLDTEATSGLRKTALHNLNLLQDLRIYE